MPKTFTYTEIRISEWIADIVNQRVIVYYEILDDQGVTREQGEAIFWHIIPQMANGDDGLPLPQPSNWYQLPLQYAQTLLDLTNDAKSALAGLLN